MNIFNHLKNEMIFKGTIPEFIHRVRAIAVENDDAEMSITTLGEAQDYIDNYCDNLTWDYDSHE